MTITHTTAPRPEVIVSSMFADAVDIAKAIIKSGKAIIEVSYNTKASLYIGLRGEGYDGGIGINQNICEDLKYLESKEFSYFDYTTRTNHYLKLTKKQRFEAIQKHVEAVLSKNFPAIGESLESLEVVYYETTALKQAIAQ